MKVFGFIYEFVSTEEPAEAGCASASTQVWKTKEEARAAMLSSANAEIAEYNREEGEDFPHFAHCEDHIWVEALEGYWTLFEAELSL